MTGRSPTWLLPLIVTTGVLATLSLNMFALPVVAPWAAVSVGIDPAWVGVSTAIVFGTSTVTSAAAGGFVRRWGAVRVLQLCLFAAALSASLLASGQILLGALAAAVLGLGFGPETPAASRLLSRETPQPSLSFVFSVKQIGIQLGALAASLAIPLLLLRMRWQIVMLVIAALTFGIAVALLPLHRKYDIDRDATARLRVADLAGGLLLVFGDASLRQLLPAAFTYSALQQSVNTFLVIHFNTDLDQPLATAGALLAVAQVAGVVGRIGWGIVADRWLAPQLVLCGLGMAMTVAVLALAILPQGVGLGPLFCVCALFGLSGTAWNGIFVAEVARLAPDGRASDAIGGLIAAAYSGVVVGPLLIGAAVTSGASYQSCFLALAFGSLLGTAVLFGSRARARQDARWI